MSNSHQPDGQSTNQSFHTFASTTVHHLRESVRTVKAHATLIQLKESGTFSNEAAKSFEFLIIAASKMQNLLDGLAEFAAVSAGTSNLAFFDLNLPLTQALNSLEPSLASTKAIITNAELPSTQFDFDQLQLVFHHLVRNALQYCEEARPEISIWAERADSYWQICVADNGPGVAPAYHERIFELYSRLHGSGHPGNGLGLAICKTIICNHGGRIYVESDGKSGSKFVFTLPFFDVNS